MSFSSDLLEYLQKYQIPFAHVNMETINPISFPKDSVPITIKRVFREGRGIIFLDNLNNNSPEIQNFVNKVKRVAPYSVSVVTSLINEDPTRRP